MTKEVIIDGVTYVPKEENKVVNKRDVMREYFVDKHDLQHLSDLTEAKINDDEIIVAEDSAFIVTTIGFGGSIVVYIKNEGEE